MQAGILHHKSKTLLSGFLTLCLLLTSQTGFTQNDFFGSVAVDIPRSAEIGASYSLFGWLTQKVAYSLETPATPFSRQRRELSKVETSLFAQFDAPLDENFNLRISGKAYHDAIYSITDEPQFTADERNKYRNRFEVKDFFIERQFDKGAYLKLGNQLFAWGLAEYSRVTDLINTEDQLTFGQQDLEDIRLQVPAALLSFNVGDWTVDSVLTYDAGSNDIAPAGDEFDQLLRLRDSGLTLLRDKPDNLYEGFMRASTHWSRGDLQIVVGEFNDNTLSLAHVEALKSISPRLTFSQNRMRALGVAGNWVNGSWLMFAELGVHKDKAVRPAGDLFFGGLQILQEWAEKDQVLSVIGAEYNGLRNMVLTFEIDNTHTRDHDVFMANAENELSFGSRLRWTAFNERLELLAVWSELVDANARIGRLSAIYNWSDQLELGLLGMSYSSERDSLYYDYRNNDIVQLQLQYKF